MHVADSSHSKLEYVKRVYRSQHTIDQCVRKAAVRKPRAPASSKVWLAVGAVPLNDVR